MTKIPIQLVQRGLFAGVGNHYSLPFTKFAELEPQETLRIGLLHYNTAEDVERLLLALDEIVEPQFTMTETTPKIIETILPER